MTSPKSQVQGPKCAPYDVGRWTWDAGLALGMLFILGCVTSNPSNAETPAPPPPPTPAVAPAPATTPAHESPAPAPKAQEPKKQDEDVDALLKKAQQTLDKSVKQPPVRAAMEDFSPRRLVEIALDRAKLEGKKGAELWMSPDGGRTWMNQGEVDIKRPTAGYLAPADGRYGFTIVPISPGGLRDFTPKEGDAVQKTVVVDTRAPIVEVKAPNGGELLGVGRSTVVQWVAMDANMHPEGITIEASADSGSTWVTVKDGLPNTGSYHWDIHFASSAHCRVRVKARDLAGNVGTGMSDRDFVVDGQPPDLRITGPASSNEIPVKLEWTGGDPGGSGLRKISLYVTRDRGQTWSFYGDDPGLKSPFLFKDLDGIYGLMLVGEDKVGNANPAPVPGTPPPFTLVLDRTKPEVKILSPQAGGVFGGVAVDIRWTAKDNLDMPKNAVALLYSPDDGKTWSEIARGLQNEGIYKWTPPKTAGKESRIKAVAADFAGNEGFALSDRFGIDLNVPEARALGPDRSNAHAVQIAYEIRNRGSAPIKKVTLWYRPEHVKEWIKYGDDPDSESPMLFAKADGKYGLYVTCATEHGLASENHQKPPEEGVEPQLTLTIDATPPQIWLESFNDGGYFMAGALLQVKWKMVEPNPDPRGLEIYHTPDGGTNWNVVATGLDPSKGDYRWVVPNSQGARHKLRLVCADRFGNKSQVESEKPFTIDNDLPVVTILEKPAGISRQSRLTAKYKASDFTSGVDRVVLFAKKIGAKGSYKELSVNRHPEGTIECDMPGEGLWDCLVVAYDLAGHASADPARDPKPDFRAGFDFTKPEIAIKYATLEQGTKTPLTGLWEIEWTAKDNLSPPDRLAVRIEHSEDAGKTWAVWVDRHPNTGRADLRAYLTPGKKVRIRLTAFDEAGNEAEDASSDVDPGDVKPPALVLRGIEDGRQYVVGSAVTVTWAAPGSGIREANLELSKDGGRTWSPLAEMRTPSMRALLPEKAGRYHVRVTAKDVTNRIVSSNFIQFDTIEGVEPVRIVTNPTVAPGKLITVLVEPKLIVKTAKELRLEITDAKGAPDWRKVTDVKSHELSALAPAVSGDYLFRVVVKAPDGREYDSNHARFRVTGKDAGRGLELVTFRGGEVQPGGASRLIKINTAVNLKEVQVEFSEASGREGTWKEVSRTHLQPVNMGLVWELPMITKSTCRLRISYRDAGGVELHDESEKDFAVDSMKPAGRVMGPTGETPIPVKIDAQIDPSISPVRQATLYVRKGGAWALEKTYDVPGAILFAPAESGDYEVYLAVRSEVGLASEPPTSGTKAQAVIKARGKGNVTPPPATGPIAFQTSMKDIVKGGTTIEVSWSSSAEGKVRLLLVADGKPSLVKENLPSTGSFSWLVPKVEAKNCQLLLEMGGEKATSTRFTIKSSPPEIKDAEIEVPLRR